MTEPTPVSREPVKGHGIEAREPIPDCVRREIAALPYLATNSVERAARIAHRAIAELEAQLAAAQFAPLGDNHHNAAKCPYCNPEWQKLRAELGAVREARDDAKSRARKAAQILIEAIGAPGPENVEDTAVRAVAKIKALEAEINRLVPAKLRSMPSGFREWVGNAVDVAVSPMQAEMVWIGINQWRNEKGEVIA